MWIFLIIIILLIPAAYIFLISPRLFGKADMEFLDVDYAHRGLWNDTLPENSLGAFKNAVQRGYGIELDLQLSSDKRIMVFHDASLKRMCGVDKKVSECTFEELKATKLLDSEYTVPAFVDVLRAVNGKVPLLIELKGVTLDTELCDVIAPMLDSYTGEFVVESFNPFLLKRMKELRPSIARGQLVTSLNKRKMKEQSAIKNYALAAMLTNFLSRPNFIAYDMNYPKTLAIFVTTRLFGAPKCVWTVDKNDDYVKYLSEEKYPIFDRFTPEK